MLNLTSAKFTLNKMADILEKDHITYWIDSGTLLSALRDNTINVYDHDIDIRVKESEFTDERIAEFVKIMWSAGFREIESLHDPRTQILFGNGSEMIDFKFCYEDNEHLWYYIWREPSPLPMLHVYPVSLFNPLGKIKLMEREYPCPQPVEEYILHHYGPDWRKFKTRVEEAEETDATWDYMKDPPACMTQGEFFALKHINPMDLYGTN